MIARQFFIYILIGLVCAATDLGLMKLLISFNTHYLVAASFGFIIGLILNFLMHSKITFKKGFSIDILRRYMTVVFVNYVLVLIMVKIFNELLSMPVLGKIISLPFVAINGFFLSKYWIYNSNRKSTSTPADSAR